MKRILAFILVACMAFSLCACDFANTPKPLNVNNTKKPWNSTAFVLLGLHMQNIYVIIASVFYLKKVM